ncbi:pectinesterase family protein [Glycomyces buryatensis]|uniref:Pectinesterase n=1 Tax=Glycomyces buryatensis TaxID=2570927 RepID=A0A4S8Q7H9_9ACTN|nr:pectinesterase family protein [Glycomyces buryatensis]THV40090.1 pectin esterase [Glycomyces buryatensis]
MRSEKSGAPALSRRGRAAAVAAVLGAALAAATAFAANTTANAQDANTADTEVDISQEADLIVAADGSGTHTSVQEAVDAASPGFTILVRPGTYQGNVTVPSDKTGLTLVGESGNAEDVVITDNRCAACDNGDGGTWGTTGSASVTLNGGDFTALDLTFENAYDEAANGNSQAVAVKVNGDKMVFENVRFLGNQDTLYANSPSETEAGRQYYKDCYVEGDVDFIFGRGTAVFDDCTIHSLDRGSDSNNGYITAASTDLSQEYGYLFTGCTLTSDAADGSVYLGRPWPAGGSESARGQVLYRDCDLGAHIRDDPWTDMSGLSWRDARLSEYQNTGEGAGVNDDRPQMSDDQAAGYQPENYLSGDDGWNPITE